jgi:hypothetical protein
MDLNVYIARNYTKYTLLEGTKKQTQSKPNKACPFGKPRTGSERSRVGQFVFMEPGILLHRWGVEYANGGDCGAEAGV